MLIPRIKVIEIFDKNRQLSLNFNSPSSFMSGFGAATVICFVTLAFFMSVISGCKNENKTSNIPADDGYLKVEELQRLKETREDLVILDVRTVDEVESGMIPGAFNVDFHTGNFKQALMTLDKKAPIVVYCQSGGRSGKTVEMLRQAGYEQVYDFGGYDRWKPEE